MKPIEIWHMNWMWYPSNNGFDNEDSCKIKRRFENIYLDYEMIFEEEFENWSENQSINSRMMEIIDQ